MKRLIGFISGFIRMKWEQFIIGQVDKLDLSFIFETQNIDRELELELKNIDLEDKLYKIEDDYSELYEQNAKLYDEYSDLYFKHYGKELD